MENNKPPAGVAIPEIKTAADFWRHVQSPSTRIKDANLQRELSLDAARHFKDPLVRLAGVTVHSYRVLEKEVPSEALYQELVAITHGAISHYPEQPGFQQLRWLVSANISLCSVEIARGDLSAAFDRAMTNVAWTEHAHGLGQVFTNVIKSCLLAIALVHLQGEKEPAAYETCHRQASKLLEYSARVPQHYSFASQFAYEELASVYNMLRQIFRWNQLYLACSAAGRSPQADAELAGFEPKALGGFLFKLLKGELPPKSTV